MDDGTRSKTSMDRIPVIFVIDIDGTLIGRVDFQSQRYSLQQLLKKHGYRTPTNLPEAFKPGHGLVRPFVKDFMRAVKQITDGNCYFFIYTASERKWAVQEIAWIEKAHGIQFDRPLFCRDDCLVDPQGTYRKSLKRIWPRITRVVGKHHVLTTKEKDLMMHRRTVMIDNNAVYVDHTDRLLLCPDYSYMVFENLLDTLPDNAWEHPTVRQHVMGMMSNMVNEGLVCPVTPNAPMMERMVHGYKWLAAKCATIMEYNKPFQHDTFWMLLRKLIIKNNIKDFPSSVVTQLQQLIWKRYTPKTQATPRSHRPHRAPST